MGKPKNPPTTPPSCDGMSNDEIIRDLWRAHYDADKGVMIRLDRVERKVNFAQWIGTTALAGAIAGALDWAKRKVFA